MSIGLPLELYRPICENLDRNTLLNLTIISRSFQIEAERLLYQGVSLHNSLFKARKRCKHLLSTPRFLGLVQHLHIPDLAWGDILGGYYGREGEREMTVVSFVELLAPLLAQLPNLLGLTIRPPPNQAATICVALAQRCTFRLRFLRCNFVPNPEFLSFLTNQTSIRELEWIVGPLEASQLVLPSGALPNLTILTLNSADADDVWTQFLAGRSVTRLQCSSLSLSPARYGRGLFAAPLKGLHVSTGITGNFGFLAQMCPSLEYLGYITSDVATGPVFLSEVAPHLKSLRILDILHDDFAVPSDAKRVPSYMLDVNNKLVTQIHAAYPSLSMVQIEWLDDECLTVYEWDHNQNIWRSLPGYDLWDEFVEKDSDPFQRLVGRFPSGLEPPSASEGDSDSE